MRKVVYMKNNPITEKEITITPPVHHLEIGDVLFVRVLSQNDKSHEFFNVETNTNSSINNTSMASLYLNGSTVNSSGTIEIPHTQIAGELGIDRRVVDSTTNAILQDVELKPIFQNIDRIGGRYINS